MDVLFVTHILEDFWPDSNTDLSQVGLLEQQHVSPRLPYPSTNRKRDFIALDCLVNRAA